MYATERLTNVTLFTAAHNIDVLYHCHGLVVNDFWCSMCFGRIARPQRHRVPAYAETTMEWARATTLGPRNPAPAKAGGGDDDGVGARNDTGSPQPCPRESGGRGRRAAEAGLERRGRSTTDVVGEGEASPGTVPTIRMSARTPSELLRESAAGDTHFSAAPCSRTFAQLLRYLALSTVHCTVSDCPADAAR